MQDPNGGPVDPAAYLLAALSGGDFNAQHTFQTFPEGPPERPGARILHGTYRECEPELRRLNAERQGIFFTVQQTDGQGRRTENVVAARAIFVDQDTVGRPFPLPVPVPPTCRVVTSPGKEHVYWALRHSQPLDLLVPVLKSLAAEMETDPIVCKAVQVLRLPGFYHCKGDPVLSELTEFAPDRLYSYEEVLAGFQRPAEGHLAHYARWQYGRILERLRLAGEGERNNAIHRAAWMAKDFVRDGLLDADAVTEDILKIATGLPGTRPVSQREALTAIRSGLSSEVESDNYKEAKAAALAAPMGAPAPTHPTSSPIQAEGPDGVAGPAEGERVFGSGLEADLATSFLDDCGAKEGIVKSTGSEFWGYSADTGIWKRLEMDRVKSYVQTYHGAWVYPPNGRVQQLSMNPRRRDAVIDLALYDQRILSPGWFDAAPIGVQFADGWASVRDGQLIHEPASHEHRCRTRLDYSLLEGPEPVQWLAFLSELFPYDPALPLILQEAIGGALLGIATQWQKCVILKGGGSNGKSVLLSAFARHLFPSDILSYVPPGRWGQEYYVHALQNALLNIVGELPSWNIVNTDAFKSIIAGDPVIARPPYGRPISFRPRALHMFACNELPATRDYTVGFWRRFVILPFNASFDGSSHPEQVLARFAGESSGIARWALAGAQRLLSQGGYTKSESQTAVETEWKVESDPVRGFLAICGEPGETSASELYRHFRLWCESTGRHPLTGARFGRRLRDLGVTKRRTANGFVYNVGIKPVTSWGFESD